MVILILLKVYDPYSNNCIVLTDTISKPYINCKLNETEDNNFKNKKMISPCINQIFDVTVVRWTRLIDHVSVTMVGLIL